MKRKRRSALLVLCAATTCLWFGRTAHGEREKSVADVVAKHRAAVEAKFSPIAKKSGVSWPPARLYVLAFKREGTLEAWCANNAGPYALLGTWRITKSSGTLGPKRKEGDRQVPEGFYRLPRLNPNSAYHLSIFVDYPNQTDIKNSKVRRSEMGGEIYVHGKAVTIGCIPIGDGGIEELFTICALVPSANRRILICPVDFRLDPNFKIASEEPWVLELYESIKSELQRFPKKL